ncbi:hypothetical protein [Aeromicrobium sp. UC242_57]|uniref:hypothetical protein n=1 Tax=Aeromicrobium sp. UC242_57 TaxID=3374624 RepID=UPI00379B1079
MKPGTTAPGAVAGGPAADTPVAADGAVVEAASGQVASTATPVASTLPADAHSGPSPVLTALVIGLLLAALGFPPIVSHWVDRSGGRR